MNYMIRVASYKWNLIFIVLLSILLDTISLKLIKLIIKAIEINLKWQMQYTDN